MYVMLIYDNFVSKYFLTARNETPCLKRKTKWLELLCFLPYLSFPSTTKGTISSLFFASTVSFQILEVRQRSAIYILIVTFGFNAQLYVLSLSFPFFLLPSGSTSSLPRNVSRQNSF